MENNIYTAPEAELIDGSNAQAVGEHYVLPQSKLWIFSLLSFGIFLVPWNYMHWRRIKQNENSDIWPAPRALFSIFFVNSLFTKFELSKVRAGAEHSWSPSANAGFFIIFSIIGNVLDRIYEGASFTIGTEYWLLFLCSWIVPVLNVSNAQRVANIALNDPRGESNSKWTATNYIWLLICIAFWGLIMGGAYYGEI